MAARRTAAGPRNAAHPKGRPARLCRPGTPLFVLVISLRNIGPIVKGKRPKPGRIFLPGPPPLQKMVNEFRRQIIYGKLFNPHPLYILAIAKE